MTKGGVTATIVGGRTGDGKSIPAAVIFDTGSLDVTMLHNAPQATFIDEEKKVPLEPVFFANEKGSMTDELACQWLTCVIM